MLIPGFKFGQYGEIRICNLCHDNDDDADDKVSVYSHSVSIQGTKLVYSEFAKSLEVLVPIYQNLNGTCKAYLDSYINQLLSQCEWENKLVRLWRKNIETLLRNIKCISSHIKVKKLVVSGPQECEYLQSIAFSKNVSLKSMRSVIKAPKILLVNFSMDHSASTELTNIDTMIAQEKQHFGYLINVIKKLSPRPTLVLSGFSINRHFLEIFANANISVLTNVKTLILEHVSSSINIDIITSLKQLNRTIQLAPSHVDMLHLTTPVGSGYELFQIRTFISKGQPKHVAILSSPSSCCVLLKGKSPLVLAKLKPMIKFILFCMFSLSQEAALIQDFAQTKHSLPFNLQLSTSSSVTFPEPHLLAMVEKYSKQLQELANLYNLENHMEIVSRMTSDLNYIFCDSTLTEIALERINYKRDLLTQLLQYYSNLWKMYKLKHPRYLEISSHQHFCFSYFTTVNSRYCKMPEVLSIEFYVESNDVSLGQCVEQLLASISQLCLGCGQPFSSHTRVYVHGNGRLEISVHHDLEVYDEIHAWYSCNVCNHSSTPTQVQGAVYNYSFGKFLELMFLSKTTSKSCGHDFKDHTRWFSLNGHAAKVAYTEIQLSEISCPKLTLLGNPDTNIDLKISAYKFLDSKIHEFFDTIVTSLSNITAEKVSQKVAQLILDAKTQESELSKQLKDIFDTTSYQDYIGLNKFYSKLQESYISWNEEFANFNISSMASMEFLKYFGDSKKEPEEKPQKPAEKSPKPGFSPKVSMLPAINTVVPKSPLPKVKDRISQLEALIAENLPSPVTLPKSPLFSPLSPTFDSKYLLQKDFSSYDPKVGKMKEHFNYMQRKFAKENSVRKAKPIPTTNTQAIMYRNVKDAIDEDASRSSMLSTPSNSSEPPAAANNEKLYLMMKKFLSASGSSLPPLNPPFAGHISLDSSIIIQETVPTSVVAFALNSQDYTHRLNIIRSEAQVSAEQLLLKKSSVHLRYNFADSPSSFSCKLFYVEQFDVLRSLCGIESYVQSLSCGAPDMTEDKRYVIKQLTASQLSSLVDILPNYFEYMAQALLHGLPTALVKIFGVYQVTINKKTKLNLLVLENIFHLQDNLSVFKISLASNNVFYTRVHSRKQFKASILNDTLFLDKINVKDYTLLVGVNRNHMVVGLTDYFGSWHKSLEVWINDNLTLLEKKPNDTITPKQYKKQFRSTIDRTILLAPDSWHSA